MGPTASGKSALALRLCAELPCEIVSVDSGQIYQGMDIGTIISTLYIPVIVGDLIATIILVPILVYAWEPVKAQLGR